MKNNSVFRLLLVFNLIFGLAVFASAQETTKTTVTTTKVTETVQNPDGTYTVIEYPVGKETVIELTPTDTTMKARGTARVMRMDDGTNVNVELNDIDNANYFVYAVDSTGKATFLGPISVADRMGKASFQTPMDQFMLVLSPTENLSAIDNNTSVSFRSTMPQGQAVVPAGRTTSDGEKQVAVSDTVNSTYEVPLLNVPSFNNKTTEIRINFSGDLQGLKGKAYIDPRKDGATQIKMRFDDMKMAPKEKRFVLWAVSPDKQYTKIGQVINTGKRQESEIRGETAMRDFGLFVTVEEADVMQPTGRTYSVFSVNK